MIFVSQLLMLLIILIPQINSAVVKDTSKIEDVLHGVTNPALFKTKGRTNKDDFSFTSPRLLFQIIQNLTSTKAPNLKANIFDKMLSDELLSIKKHFYEKEISINSVTKATMMTNIHTPTLEVNQHWPMKGFSIKRNNEPEQTTPASNIKTSINYNMEEDKKYGQTSNSGNSNHDAEISIENKDTNVKVLGLRSLPQVTPNALSHTYYHNQAAKMCTCIKTNNPTACTNRCTASSLKPACSHASSVCTNSVQIYSISPIYFATIQPYFIGVTTEYPYRNSYYHPNVINDLKLPRKTKRRKPSKVYVDKNLYYDSDEDDSIEVLNQVQDDEYFDKPRATHKTTSKREDLIPLNFKNREKLVQDIFNDLKTHYPDTVVKDCYCSSISSASSYIFSFVKYLKCFFISMVLMFLL